MAKVRFAVKAPKANDVYLVGDFSDWDETANKMRRSPKDKDIHVKTLDLEPGRYEFKYLVDGEWICAEDSPRALNEFGTENSVIVVE